MEIGMLIFLSGSIGHCTEMRFASCFSGGFITAIVVNPPDKRLAKRTSVHCTEGRISLWQDKKAKKISLKKFVNSGIVKTCDELDHNFVSSSVP